MIENENKKNPFYRKIPGYRSGTPWKMVLASIFYLVVIFNVFSGNDDKPPQQTPPIATQSTGMQAPIERETNQGTAITVSEAKVISITDGDTIKVSLNGKTEDIRLIGVDTPETVDPSTSVQPYGPEASAYTKQLLTDKTVYLELDVQERDQYGRLLAYVWMDKPADTSKATILKSMHNALLLTGGYAQVATYPPNVKYVDTLIEIQTEARTTETGLWKPAPEPTKPATTIPIPTPTPTPTPKPTPTPTPKPTPTPQTKLSVLNYTKTVSQGGTANITIQGKPNTKYTIKVTYKTTVSTAQGLEVKTSGSDGKATWTWKVGSNTTPGSWPIDVSGDGQSVRVTFVVQ